ncbi:allograft inflammatory factor 1-like [Alligator sinensis]|uniref:Allograft inflammatory factor 1-like n=1 Tax=Alligator sinensis TaxID=38654 RepID=A0A1U7R5U9_ALLSI|nr:allograft inflammatory factor 1-like [Alligator sinensis]
MAGKEIPLLKNQEMELYLVNKEYLADEPFQDIPNLQEKLELLKGAFLEYDAMHTGEIDYPTLSNLLREFQVFRSLLELRVRVQDITGNAGSTVPYKDFVMAMLGRRSTMCQRFLQYSGKEGDAVKKPSLIEPGSHASYLGPETECISSPLSTLPPPPPPPSPADG